MSSGPSDRRQVGFTLIELMVALGIFLLITGAAFTLLGTSKKHYQTESQVLTSFQEARLGLDQIVRDVNDAGYPPPTFLNSSSPTLSVSSPFAWSPSYPLPPVRLLPVEAGIAPPPPRVTLLPAISTSSSRRIRIPKIPAVCQTALFSGFATNCRTPRRYPHSCAA